MTTPYTSTDEWAETRGYATFAAYTADGNPEPNLTKLTFFLEKATRIMNNSVHLSQGTTNLTDTAGDLKDLCITITNRMMDVERNRGFMGGGFTFSPQDFMYAYERKDLLTKSKISGKRKVGKVVF